MKSIQLLSARSSATAARATTRVLRTHTYTRTVSIRNVPRPQPALLPSARTFSSCRSARIGLTPESDDPKPTSPQASHTSSGTEPASISDAEYHEISDQYMNTLQLVLEEAADKDHSKGLEVEYSAGVLTVTHPSKGTYVINKQPPNKQIWLSSPESGPKRFDWVLSTAASHDSMNSKQDTEGSTGSLGDDGQLGGGKWIYIRDGTAMSELIQDELGVTVAKQDEPDATQGREGPGGSGSGGGIGATGGTEG